MVTRARSCPLASRALAVASVSTTTWNSFPPAATSSAVAALGSLTLTRRASTPLTLLLSKFLSGSAYLKSRPVYAHPIELPGLRKFSTVIHKAGEARNQYPAKEMKVNDCF